MSVQLVLQVFLQVGFGLSTLPRVIGAPTHGTAAADFFAALVTPSSVLRSIKGRWLVVAPGCLSSVVTQELRWDIKGEHSELESPWRPEGPQIESVSEGRRGWRWIVLMQFSDGSRLGLHLPKTSRRRLLESLPRTDLQPDAS